MLRATLSATGMVFDLQPCDNYRTMTASSAHSAAAMQHPTAPELAILEIALVQAAPELHDGRALGLFLHSENAGKNGAERAAEFHQPGS